MLGMYLTDRRSMPSGMDAGTVPPRATVPDDWREEVDTGIMIGPADAPVTIVEFMDLQCPACAQWALRVDSLVTEFPDQVQVVMHHFPISELHPHALPAAVAAECANRQDRFAAFARTVFSRQVLLGTMSWRDFARDAGVPDLDAFDSCADLPPDSFPRIAYGLDLALATGARGTPTVWINGELRKPSLEQLRQLVRYHAGLDSVGN